MNLSLGVPAYAGQDRLKEELQTGHAITRLGSLRPCKRRQNAQKIYLSERKRNRNHLQSMNPPLKQRRSRCLFQLLLSLLLGIGALAQDAPPSKPAAAPGTPPKNAPSSDAPCAATGKGGTVNFANRAGAGRIDARVFDAGGKEALAGPAYLAQLYGAPCDREASFVPFEKPVPFRIGVAAGYVTSSTATLPNVAPRQPVHVQMRCWEAAFPTYERALEGGGATGKSVVVRVIAGGAIPGIVGIIPPDLVGLKSFSLSAAKPK